MNKTLQLGDKTVSESSPCFIIAEIGANHDNNIEQAFKMIDIAVECGADAAKFQSYKAKTLYSRYVPRRNLGNGKLGPEIYPMIEKIQMPYEWHPRLKAYCDKRGILFFSTPFDMEAVDSLEEAGAPFYKVASSEIGDPILLKKIARTQKPIIISTGKASLGEVETAMRWVLSEGNDQIVLLHCTATYPAVYEAMNLRAMATMREAFQCLVGLSDHNLENITAVAAVALGAKVVEKHLTLSRQMEGPDHAYALEPDKFAELVNWIRKTEVSLGTGIKEMHSTEKEGRRIANRSIHVRDDLPAGHVIQESDLTIKRPSLGIPGLQIDIVVGRTLKKPIKADMWLTWEDL